MRRSCMVRSARACAVAVMAAALGLSGAVAPISSAWAAETDSASLVSTFNDAYTAWSGYATTAAESAVPGAVPVTAPAAAQVAWSAEAESCALRQQGQSTFLFAVGRGAVTKYNAATGEVLAHADLDAKAIGTCSFVDGVLLVPLIDGRLAAFDEDLTCAWTSDTGVAESTLGDWEFCSAAASGGGCAYLTFVARGDGGSEVAVGAFSLVDGALLWGCSLDAVLSAGEEVSTPVLAFVDAEAVSASEGSSEGADSVAAGSSDAGESADASEGELSNQGEDSDGGAASEEANASGVGLLLATDGSAGVYLLNASTGELRASRQAVSEGNVASAAVLPDDAVGLSKVLVLAGSDGSVQLAGVDNTGALVAGSQVSIEDDLAGCAPVACNGSVLVAGASGMVYQVEFPSSLDESLQVTASVDTGTEQEISAVLPVAFGDDARSMTLTIYANGIDGSLYALVCDGVDIQTAVVQQLSGDSSTSGLTASEASDDAADGTTADEVTTGGEATTSEGSAAGANDAAAAGDATASAADDATAAGDTAESAANDATAVGDATASAADEALGADSADDIAPYVRLFHGAAPVVNRDGTLYTCANGQLTAYAADSERAASTAVGGANGLDTVAGSLAGISLPNGAGLGVGVLIFAVGFGAYAYIRNGGGRRAHDEGLDEYRSRRGGGSR